MTWEKMNDIIWLLIYDDHENHIMNQFLSHYLKHDIQVILFLSHTSHLLQSLNIDIFNFLKYYLSWNLDKFVHIRITKLEKCEWMKCFVKACSLILISKNIQSDFKAIDIYSSINHFKILDKFSLHESINITS